MPKTSKAKLQAEARVIIGDKGRKKKKGEGSACAASNPPCHPPPVHCSTAHGPGELLHLRGTPRPPLGHPAWLGQKRSSDRPGRCGSASPGWGPECPQAASGCSVACQGDSRVNDALSTIPTPTCPDGHDCCCVLCDRQAAQLSCAPSALNYARDVLQLATPKMLST